MTIQSAEQLGVGSVLTLLCEQEAGGETSWGSSSLGDPLRP